MASFMKKELAKLKKKSWNFRTPNRTGLLKGRLNVLGFGVSRPKCLSAYCWVAGKDRRNRPYQRTLDITVCGVVDVAI